MLLLPGRRVIEAWEPARGSAFPEIGEHGRDTPPVYFVFKGRVMWDTFQSVYNK